MGIKGVAFDLDGTLYPNYRFYRRLVLSFFAHPRFFGAFATVRHQLHREGTGTSLSAFLEEQSAMMAAILGEEKGLIRQKIDRLVYRDWEEKFSGIRLFPRVKETLAVFRQAGLTLALLSDFPPVRKITLLELEGYFDLLLSTEETGRLKPSTIPFAKLARTMALEPGEILYVGNSLRYDTAGSRAAGMRSALIRRGILSTGYCPGTGGADFVFRDYRQLQEYVLR
jgi:putative hydrolase of the HAD superfamily